MALENLGSGFPMFYRLKWFFGSMYFIMIVISAIFCLYSNIAANNGKEWIEGNNPTFVVKMSIGNHGNESSDYRGIEI